MITAWRLSTVAVDFVTGDAVYPELYDFREEIGIVFLVVASGLAHDLLVGRARVDDRDHGGVVEEILRALLRRKMCQIIIEAVLYFVPLACHVMFLLVGRPAKCSVVVLPWRLLAAGPPFLVFLSAHLSVGKGAHYTMVWPSSSRNSVCVVVEPWYVTDEVVCRLPAEDIATHSSAKDRS